MDINTNIHNINYSIISHEQFINILNSTELDQFIQKNAYYDTPFHIFCKHGDNNIDNLIYFLQFIANYNLFNIFEILNRDSHSPFHLFCISNYSKKNLKIFLQFLKKHNLLNILSKHNAGFTPFHLFCLNNENKKSLKYFLHFLSKNNLFNVIKIKNFNGESFLTIFFRNFSNKSLKTFLKFISKYDLLDMINEKSYDGITSFNMFCRNTFNNEKDLIYFLQFLNNHNKLDIINYADNGFLPFVTFCLKNNEELVIKFIDFICTLDITLKNNIFQNIIMQSKYIQNDEIVTIINNILNTIKSAE